MSIHLGFDGAQYISQQKEAILERMSHFHHRLYLEVGGKFLYDGHASRVLPGFDPASKAKIFASLFDQMDVIFCINYNDILHNRQLAKDDIDYTTYVQNMLVDIEKAVGKKPFISCNMCPRENFDAAVIGFLQVLESSGHQCFKRYIIEGYPHNMQTILSAEGYGHDEYIPVQSQLVIVTGAASNSGKLSTCLGQMYQDTVQGLDSGYAKYETFPIWNLPLKHAINLAYEAATADIGDYNMLDSYHKEKYGIDAVNYNRDVEAFDIVMHLADAYLPETNYTRSYRSPTDMGINKAGFSITDDAVCRESAIAEIQRRASDYQTMVDRGEGQIAWVEKCKELEKECLDYI